MTTSRRRPQGIRAFAEQVSRQFRWIDRTLRDVMDALNYLGSRVAAIEEQLGITPPPPPKSRKQIDDEESLRLRAALRRKKTPAPSGDGGADSTQKGKSAATDIRDGLHEPPEGTPMTDTNDTAGGRDDS
ncbi:hypothetical protein [Williamsia sp.]|uniref:hypothetical protein n=1 Tax=Williamsia sp. TaxID=1872085 RepID=UPI002F923F41